ncbi:uncharacterized protein LOC129605959 [Condylostylus longicornis]|uniref:uncharacterized protein LOC129605959 n=1 Tax=Condylostylus longicornis TaxID=2530218 RepID=UPI00244E4EFF|nr:uncharacterized protein LOC129605959 [Condylostylus longicornis]
MNKDFVKVNRWLSSKKVNTEKTKAMVINGFVIDNKLNFKHHVDYISEERRTLKLVEDKQCKLDEIWKNYEENDDKIRTKYGEMLDHPYFVQDHRGQTAKLYEMINQKLISKKKSLIELKKQLSIEEDKERVDNEEEESGPRSVIADVIKLCLMNESAFINLMFGFDLERIQELELEWHRLTIKLKEKCAVAKVKVGEVETYEKVTPRISLPTIEVPKFNGDYFNWVQFRDLFTKMIDRQSHLSDTEKMYYLKTNLSGEAERLIRHLTITESNYDLAWKILSNRYDNKRLLSSNILDRLINQPNISIGSAKQLKAMLDTTRECILMLENLGLKIFGNWDPIILHILIKKLDKDSNAQYEHLLESPKELQSLKDFLMFFENRFESTEAVGMKQPSTSQKWEKGSSHVVAANSEKCIICNKTHPIHKCDKFLGMKLMQREIEIKKHKLCFNCLKKGHSMNKCLTFGCRVCKRKHNTLLHRYKNMNENQEINKQEAANMAGTYERKNDKYVFLGTAVISAYTKKQERIDCRVLLDSRSQLNFISEKLMRRLGLDAQKDKLDICGIGKCNLSSNGRVNIKISSKTTNYETTVEAYVIKEITNLQPHRQINIEEWPLQNIALSDPNFNIPRRVDMLLGAEMYAEFMRNGQIKIGPNLPTLQKTVFGWMVFGKMSLNDEIKPFSGITNEELEESLMKFWDIEEIKDTEKQLTKSENLCEEHFKNTFKRDHSGRFEVSLPILGDLTVLGDSRKAAFRRFLNIEEKLRKNQQLRVQYTEFMKEYEILGHMEKVPVMRYQKIITSFRIIAFSEQKVQQQN